MQSPVTTTWEVEEIQGKVSITGRREGSPACGWIEKTDRQSAANLRNELNRFFRTAPRPLTAADRAL